MGADPGTRRTLDEEQANRGVLARRAAPSHSRGTRHEIPMMTRNTTRLAWTLGLAGALACASTGGSAEVSNRPARSERNLLRTAELSEAQKDLTVMEVLRQLKPHFLSGTGAMTSGNTGLHVYQDDSRMGGAAVLNEIRMREVVEVRYLNASEASGRFGLGHEGGAIVIKRRR